jgi:hypothetical protein
MALPTSATPLMSVTRYGAVLSPPGGMMPPPPGGSGGGGGVGGEVDCSASVAREAEEAEEAEESRARCIAAAAGGGSVQQTHARAAGCCGQQRSAAPCSVRDAAAVSHDAAEAAPAPAPARDDKPAATARTVKHMPSGCDHIDGGGGSGAPATGGMLRAGGARETQAEACHHAVSGAGGNEIVLLC